jgi:hypothetical protein
LPPPTTRPITTISTTSAAPELSTTAGNCSYSFLIPELVIIIHYNYELLSEPFFTTMPIPSGPQFTTVGIVGITIAVCFGFVLVLIVAVAFIRYSKYSFRLVSKKCSQR